MGKENDYCGGRGLRRMLLMLSDKEVRFRRMLCSGCIG